MGWKKAFLTGTVGMGQGQDVVAMDRLQMGHTQGHWVILITAILCLHGALNLKKIGLL